MSVSPDTALKAGLWLIPILVSTGSLVYMVQENASRVDSMQDSLAPHERMPAHPVATAVLEGHEKILEALVDEQQVTRQEVQAQAIDISAICQATGANCR